MAISGLANSGKTEASKMLEYILNTPKIFKSYFGYKIFKKGKGKGTTTAFAKPLKQTLAILLNRPLEGFEDRNNKEYCYIELSTLNCEFNPGGFEINNKLTENQFSKLIKNDETLSEYSLTLRQLMQYYGTTVIRKYLGDKTGINATLNAVGNNRLIISDLRFKVEYEELKKHNGFTIYIFRPGCVPGSHASEREAVQMLNDGAFDLVIENNGSLQDLFNIIKGYAI